MFTLFPVQNVISADVQKTVCSSCGPVFGLCAEVYQVVSNINDTSLNASAQSDLYHGMLRFACVSFVLRRYPSLGDSGGEVGGAKKKNEVYVCVCALYSYLMQIIVKQFESISNAALDFVGECKQEMFRGLKGGVGAAII